MKNIDIHVDVAIYEYVPYMLLFVKTYPLIWNFHMILCEINNNCYSYLLFYLMFPAD